LGAKKPRGISTLRASASTKELQQIAGTYGEIVGKHGVKSGKMF